MRYVSHVTAALTPALRLLLTEPGAQATDPLSKTLLDRQHQVCGRFDLLESEVPWMTLLRVIHDR